MYKRYKKNILTFSRSPKQAFIAETKSKNPKIDLWPHHHQLTFTAGKHPRCVGKHRWLCSSCNWSILSLFSCSVFATLTALISLSFTLPRSVSAQSPCFYFVSDFVLSMCSVSRSVTAQLLPSCAHLLSSSASHPRTCPYGMHSPSVHLPQAHTVNYFLSPALPPTCVSLLTLHIYAVSLLSVLSPQP